VLRKQLPVNVRAYAIALTILLVAAVRFPSAEAQTYTIVHSFAAGTDGAVPTPIIRDAQGNLYGTTRFGGIPTCGLDTCGTVYKIDSAGNETVLYRFEGGSNGSNPVAGLVRDAAGNLYGTTQGNGSINGASVVFKLSPDGNETTLFEAGTIHPGLLSRLASGRGRARQPVWHVAVRRRAQLRVEQ
jgi:uncharacterized repeat protein (TIGR03803 family)